MPEVRKRRKPPSPSGSPSAAKRAPASSRALSTSRCRTSSTESPAATASTASLTALSVGLSGSAMGGRYAQEGSANDPMYAAVASGLTR